ncbi:alpha amylase C-terminal domain-containing protein [Chryseobacterium sp. NRRL B-14798]
MPKVEELPGLLEARKLFAYGKQTDYFDHPNCVAFVRKGDEKHAGCIVIMSNSEEGYKEIELGKEHADSVYTDFLKNRHEEIYTDKDGKAVFTVNSGSVSIWVKKQTP